MSNVDVCFVDGIQRHDRCKSRMQQLFLILILTQFGEHLCVRRHEAREVNGEGQEG